MGKQSTPGEFCFAMIARADIEGSKSDIAVDAWPPQASYPCGNFSDTSCLKPKKSKGSRGHAFTVCIRTENQDQASFRASAPREVSFLPELALGHLRYLLTDGPPQSNPLPGTVPGAGRPSHSPVGAHDTRTERGKPRRLTLGLRTRNAGPLPVSPG